MKTGTVCFWSGDRPQFCIIISRCKSFTDSYNAFMLTDFSSKNISLNETLLRPATKSEIKLLKHNNR